MSVVDEAHDLISLRMAQIDQERAKLERALAELGGKARRKPGSRPRSAKGTAKQRRHREGGSRLDQAVEMVEANPGIGATEIAEAMQIKPNYLYRVLGEAEAERRVRKDGRQYFPVKA